MDVQRLRDVLDYDATTGIFRWRKPNIRRVRADMIAGSIGSKGYRKISIDGHIYRAHRLAWLYVHGKWPDDQLDHINRCRDDNRIANLRPATGQQNNWNYGISRHNTSGLKGAHYERAAGKWRASITFANKTIYLGHFPTAEGAHCAYLRKATELFGDFASAGT